MDDRIESEVQEIGRRLRRLAGENPPAAYRGVTEPVPAKMEQS